MTTRRTKTKKWVARQQNDVYVKQARAYGYRSRAAYKLLEINDKHKILLPAMRVLDLGAAPGGWSQVAFEIVGVKGLVLAVDILPITDIPGVSILQGDLLDENLFTNLVEKYKDNFDLVISDMAPNLSGIGVSDQAKMISLADMALEIVKERLNFGGNFLLKLFHGQGFDSYVSLLRKSFSNVLIIKPKASRNESREVYCLAKGYNKKFT